MFQDSLFSALRTGLTTPALRRVTLFAAFVILVEVVLFRVIDYVHDYFEATMVIGHAVLGIGLGAFAAATTRIDSDKLFRLSCFGSIVTLAASIYAVLHPPSWIAMLVLPSVFVFPGWYIATIFAEYHTQRVYFFDMLGVFIGVLLVVLLYMGLRSEGILVLAATAVAGAGLMSAWRQRTGGITGLGFALLLLVGIIALITQLRSDALNFHYLIDADHPSVHPRKVFRRYQDIAVTSYDNLVARIDIIPRDTRTVVAYNGFGNDHFTTRPPRDYDRAKPSRSGWPTADRRFMYGLVEEPQVFVIGSAAEGILKTLRRITPLERIHTAEINPALLTIMLEDFYEQSGRAYEGLETIHGNALAVLRESDFQYDMITLMNTHSGRTISYPGAPDYLHTVEAYKLFFERLTEKGYLMFEERPVDRNGELALYRLINTIWRSLEENGATDPARHFVIWDWQARKAKAIRRHRDNYYVSMAVSKNPLEGDALEQTRAWLDHTGSRRTTFRVLYLKDVAESGRYAELFRMIGRQDFDGLANDFDKSVATNDRPFVEIAKYANPELTRLLRWSMGTGSALLLVICVVLSRQRPGLNLTLAGYNLLIGVGYFLVEVVLLQAYQNYFLSPASTLVLTLGFLLLSSGIGGYLSQRIPPWIGMLLLAPITLLALWVPESMAEAGISLTWVKAACVIFVTAVGFFMGIFFPRGLAAAKQRGLTNSVPYLFAINSVGGSVAVVLALVLAVTYGYRMTFALALFFYVIATVIITLIIKTAPDRSVAS